MQENALTCIEESVDRAGSQGTLDFLGPLEAGDHVAGHACEPRELGLSAGPFLFQNLPNQSVQILRDPLPQALKRLADPHDPPLCLAHVICLSARCNLVDSHLCSCPMGKKKEAQPNRL
jgi:hypothetical protein